MSKTAYLIFTLRFFFPVVLDYCVSLSGDQPAVDYLFGCYERSLLLKVSPSTTTIQENILRNAFLVLSQPELFPDQDVPNQWIDLMARDDPNQVLKSFLDQFISFIKTQEESPGLEELFRPVFRVIQVRVCVPPIKKRKKKTSKTLINF